MTSKEMLKATHKPGYWFVNVAPLGAKPNWQEQPIPKQPEPRRAKK